MLRQNKSSPHVSSVQLRPSLHSASVSQGIGELDTQPKPPLIRMHGTMVQRHLRLLRLITGPHGSSDPEAPTIPIYRTPSRHRSRPNHSNQTNTTCIDPALRPEPGLAEVALRHAARPARSVYVRPWSRLSSAVGKQAIQRTKPPCSLVPSWHSASVDDHTIGFLLPKDADPAVRGFE